MYSNKGKNEQGSIAGLCVWLNDVEVEFKEKNNDKTLFVSDVQNTETRGIETTFS